MPYSLQSKVIVIVGATQGIGAVAAQRLCAEGATVIVGGVSIERGKAFAEELRSAGGSDAASFITGQAFPIDGGHMAGNRAPE